MNLISTSDSILVVVVWSYRTADLVRVTMLPLYVGVAWVVIMLAWWTPLRRKGVPTELAREGDVRQYLLGTGDPAKEVARKRQRKEGRPGMWGREANRNFAKTALRHSIVRFSRDGHRRQESVLDPRGPCGRVIYRSGATPLGAGLGGSIVAFWKTLQHPLEVGGKRAARDDLCIVL